MSGAFDPDEYLQGESFDPDAYLKETKPERQRYSAPESFALGGAQGATLGFFDELAGAYGKLAPTWMGGVGSRIEPGAEATPEMRADFEAQPTNYQLVRDGVRQRTADAKEDNGKSFFVGELVGGVALPAGAGAQGLKQAATLGAKFGAGYGLGSSEADLTEGEYGRAALDTAVGAGAGIAGGAVGHGVARGVSALKDTGFANYLREAAKATGDKLEARAIKQGRRVLLNGADSLSSRSPTSDDAVREALESKAIRPFSTTQKTFERLQGLTEEQGERYTRIVADLEANGVKGPDAHVLADELVRRGAALEKHTMNEALPQAYVEEAVKLTGKAAPARELGLVQSENLKRSVQKMAKYGRVEETPLNEVRRDIASVFRQANEDAIESAGKAAGEGTQVRALADRFVPEKQRLGRLIEATNASERGAARAAQRREFSLTDNMFAAAGLASGSPAGLIQGAASGLGNNLLRNRGTSAIAAGSFKASQWAKALPELVTVRPELFGKYGRVLAQELKEHGPEGLIALDHALTEEDAEYRKLRETAARGGSQ